MRRCSSPEEREFYLRMTGREHWSYRELDRQIDSSLYERTMIGAAKLSPAIITTAPKAGVFKDTYVMEYITG